MKIELEKVSNGWVFTAYWEMDRGSFPSLPMQTVVVARNVPDCLAELSKIMEGK